MWILVETAVRSLCSVLDFVGSKSRGGYHCNCDCVSHVYGDRGGSLVSRIIIGFINCWGDFNSGNG